ncbi:MAG: ABC transporter permease subunit [Planctomyces sp.]|nr:ABC transporter permease subunit [Planctomyces sp.]
MRHAMIGAAMILGLAGGAFAQEPPLKWGADAEGGAPYIFLDPQDPSRLIGFEVDLAAALAERIGQPIVHHQYNYDGLISGLNRGDIDLAMNGLEITPDRAKHVRFSRPYYVYTLQLVARADETRFRSVEELIEQRLSVGTLTETAASRFLERSGLEPSLYDGQAEPYQDLALGRLDAVLMDLPIAVSYARPNPRLKFIGEPFEQGFYAIALRTSDEALAKRVDAGLESLLATGDLQRIYEKWGIWNADQTLLTEPNAAAALLAGETDGFSIRNVLWSLVQASVVTIEISVCSMALAMLLGLMVAVARLYGPRPLQWLALLWVEFFRGIPVLLLLYVLYYGWPQVLESLGMSLMFAPSRMGAAILGFGLNYSAYEAEIYRAGIQAVPQGQWEAAASLGMSPQLTFRRVILPQAMRVILPPVTNDFVALFKDTSVASAIAVVELTKQYQILAKSSQRYMEIGLATTILYLVMSVPLGYLARRLEQRWGKPQ